MNKLFAILQKPAKWIFIICGAVLGIAFAVVKAKAINGNGGFFPVLSNILILVVGTLLLLAAPVLLLLKKEEGAKMVFIFLLGYWLLWYTQRCFGLADGFKYSEGIVKVAQIFAFIVALCLVAVLALTVLEFGLNKPALRRFSVLVLFVACVLGLLAALFFFIDCLANKGNFEGMLNNVLVVFGYTFTVFFGYMHFFGAPKAE